ncbi:methyltransferase domain-containing protein [Nocardioides panacis]|uniref:L-isoaspartyl protein carboxyl methyltransferase n=1 Tax=Nocardioides panacis TaxID=2849501 RepID=A0A975SYE5_9ACTN|nr:methyltransferase domain-containing protein [Nocardioides panacis]QWZ08260.1 methyltransferase domain-containing protein [Nocardioides panacis]
MAPGRTPRRALDAAFAAAPREAFLPASQRRFARLDRPLLIGHGQTNSQPRTVRRMLALLDVRTGQRVLDVGSGSAWTTALLAALVGPGGEVVGVELVPELVEQGRANLRPFRLTHARVEQAQPGVLGCPEQAPFDRVLVSAAAPELPAGLVAQLAPDDAVLVVPVAGTLVELRRDARRTRLVEHGAYSFVPLVTDPP